MVPGQAAAEHVVETGETGARSWLGGWRGPEGASGIWWQGPGGYGEAMGLAWAGDPEPKGLGAPFKQELYRCATTLEWQFVTRAGLERCLWIRSPARHSRAMASTGESRAASRAG